MALGSRESTRNMITQDTDSHPKLKKMKTKKAKFKKEKKKKMKKGLEVRNSCFLSVMLKKTVPLIETSYHSYSQTIFNSYLFYSYQF